MMNPKKKKNNNQKTIGSIKGNIFQRISYPWTAINPSAWILFMCIVECLSLIAHVGCVYSMILKFKEINNMNLQLESILNFNFEEIEFCLVSKNENCIWMKMWIMVLQLNVIKSIKWDDPAMIIKNVHSISEHWLIFFLPKITYFQTNFLSFATDNIQNGID